MKNALFILTLLAMTLSACSKQNKLTGGGSDKDFCQQNPSACVYTTEPVKPQY